MTEYTSAVTEPLVDPLDQLQLALDVAAVPHREPDPRLHPYQRDSVDHLHTHPRAGLFLTPGLGKTAISLSALTEVHLPALVVAPRRVAENTWPEEIPKWRPDLTYSLVRGDPHVRQKKLDEAVDIYIISQDTFGGDLLARKNRGFRTVVIDELSGYKNRGTRRWRQMNKLVKDVPYVWGLTGTPAPNTYLNLWPQVFLLDKGARLERTLTAFRTRYFLPGKRLPNGVITDWTLRPGAREHIESRIKDLCLSIDKSHASYPVQNDVYHFVDLPTNVRGTYDKLHREFVIDVGETRASVETAASMTNKLSQIASGFLYHSGLVSEEELDPTEVTHLHMLKIEKLQEILEDAQGAPALVFYRFEEDRRRLLHLPGVVDIRTPHAVERWNRGNIPILIAHPASAGHGLNLQQGGNLMVWYGTTWSSEQYIQGIGRLVRQGQPSPAVAVHHILARDTVDEKALDVVQGRVTMQEALLEILRRD